ncbi:GNAT family N-acetyltransferase [Natrarchaeobaculum aegyptiacum]|uniref:GNAT family N-acetyltransferase n=1 Tax=Natrarchaeobaculum aegyptiacum TaxID=745377 RepID=A0A2Z2HVV0_9EURY|nr:GNAT family N-acetyltransferase [Natrarchaeobaculum aegyptiacum]ARS91429.1 GNAT family N-acetyltransferase [Natrarchaeobaculum aegyptiacum]
MDLEYDLLGWPSDGPKLRLDYRRFSYAGKFVMTNTGKAVVREVGVDDDGTGDDGSDDDDVYGDRADDEFDSDVVAAVAFNADRTDPDTLWLRYVTVDRHHRGEGIGPELCRFVRDRAEARGYERLRIAVNNPFAYEALYRAGFGYTGETTGIAELVLEHPRPADGSPERYQSGLEAFRERDLSVEEGDFLESRVGSEPPAIDAVSESRG